MRIGLVCPYSLDVPGGVQNHVLDLARVLLARGHEVCVLAPGDESTVRPRHVQTIGGVVPISFNGAVARVAFGPRVAARTRRWLRDGDFDVVHIHDPATPSVSLLALWASEATVVATFHAANTRSRALALAAGGLRASMEKISARVAVSETARATLVQHLGGEPVVIPNGIFCRDFEQAEPRPEWSQPGPAVVFLGRADEPRKGLPVVMGAFRDVLRAHPSASLLIAGAPRSHAVAMPGDLRGRVRLLGRLSDADRAALLASATVFVSPQLGAESFGVVLIEAMAAGAAVVASDIAPFRSILGDGELGELFTAGDSAAAARAINRALADEPRREQMRSAAAQAVHRYDWSVLSPEIEAVYETAVRAGASALTAQLTRRSSLAVELATTRLADPRAATELLDAAVRARDAGGDDGWIAESLLSRAIRRVDLPGHEPLVALLADAQRRAAVARRIHNDTAASALALRQRRRVRWLRSARSAERPTMIEFDDGMR